jgi:hypothetical protein
MSTPQAKPDTVENVEGECPVHISVTKAPPCILTSCQQTDGESSAARTHIDKIEADFLQ